MCIRDSYKCIEADPEGKHVRLHSTHMSKTDRVVKKAGHAWYVPVIYNEMVKNWRENAHVNIATILVAPMDAYGNFKMCIRDSRYRSLIHKSSVCRKPYAPIFYGAVCRHLITIMIV